MQQKRKRRVNAVGRTLVILLTAMFRLRNSDLTDINIGCAHAIYNMSQAEHYVYFPKRTNLSRRTSARHGAANAIAWHMSHSCMPC
jgi:hypothetical protein